MEGISSNPGDRRQRPTATRRSNGKSRFGCVTCKAKRIKCDEKRPVCDKCAKRNHQCHYDVPLRGSNTTLRHQPPVWNALNPPKSEKETSRAKAVPKIQCPPVDGLEEPCRSEITTTVPTVSLTIKIPNQTSVPKARDFSLNTVALQSIPESPPPPNAVNLYEMRLLMNFKDNTVYGLLPSSTTIWSEDVIRIALKHEFLMHAILMISARHLTTFDHPNEIATHRYAELQHRQHALSSFRQIMVDKGRLENDAELRDGVFASALLLAFHASSVTPRSQSFQSDEFFPILSGLRHVGRIIGEHDSRKSLFAELLATRPLLLLPEHADTPCHWMHHPATRNLLIMPPKISKWNDNEFEAFIDPRILADLEPELSPPKMIPLPISEENKENHRVYSAALVHLQPLLQISTTQSTEFSGKGYNPTLKTFKGTVIFNHTISKESQQELLRLFLTWASFCPPEFTMLVNARDPGALIILAHYYAAGAMLEFNNGDYGNGGSREKGAWWWSERPKVMCRSICGFLGQDWREYVIFPRVVAGMEGNESGR